MNIKIKTNSLPFVTLMHLIEKMKLKLKFTFNSET